MTEVNINTVDTTMVFGPDTIVGNVPAAGGAAAAAEADSEVEALRQILEPIIMQLLEDNLQQYMAMRG